MVFAAADVENKMNIDLLRGGSSGRRFNIVCKAVAGAIRPEPNLLLFFPV
jgi:hypothetical protein